MTAQEQHIKIVEYKNYIAYREKRGGEPHKRKQESS